MRTQVLPVLVSLLPPHPSPVRLHALRSTALHPHPATRQSTPSSAHRHQDTPRSIPPLHPNPPLSLGMCYIKSELVYGVLLRSVDLAIAARTHSEIAGPILAMRLIAHRRKEGSLAIQDGGARLENIPTEVWKMVGRELFVPALATGKQFVLDQSLCEKAGDDGLVVHRTERGEDAKVTCQDCFSFPEDGWNSDDARESIDCMLADYGLEMRHELNRRHADETESCDNDAAYLVGRPAQQESGIIVYQVTHVYSDAPNRMSSNSRFPVVSTGAVTAGIEARFKALMDDYPLTIDHRQLNAYPGVTANTDTSGVGSWVEFFEEDELHVWRI